VTRDIRPGENRVGTILDQIEPARQFASIDAGDAARADLTQREEVAIGRLP